MTNNLGKVPPSDIELEKAVLGAILLEKEAFTRVSDILNEDSFYKDAHSTIFLACHSLFEEQKPIDLLTVTERLRTQGKLEICGGAHYITELTLNVSSSNHLEYHARVIAELAFKRKLILVSSQVQKDAYDPTSDVFEVMASLENSLSEISGNVSTGKLFTAKQVLKENIKIIEEASKQKSGLTGIPSGYTKLDRITSGWQRSDLIIIAARPSMGKTTFVMNMAYNMAKMNFKPLIFSLEMSRNQLVNLLISIDTGIYREKIRDGKLSDSEWQMLAKARTQILENIFIQDEHSINIIQLRAICRRLVMQQKVSCIIVDYLQLISSTIKNGDNNTQTQQISRQLKIIAKENNVPVLALSQLSRAVETRGGDRKPQMSDLRNSGAIEQDADVVVFPFRPEYYGFMETEEGSSTSGLMEIQFAKHRNGQLGKCDLNYNAKLGLIKDEFEPHQVRIESQNNFPSNGLSDFGKASW